MTEAQATASTLAALSSLLDGTLDDIEDLPGFIQLPTGAYKVKLAEGFRSKEINGKPGVDLPMTVIEVIELGNPEQAPEIKVGDVATLSWMMDNDTGKGFFKEAIRPVYEFLKAKNYNEAMSNSKGLDVIIVVARTHNKEKQRDFMQLKKLTIA